VAAKPNCKEAGVPNRRPPGASLRGCIARVLHKRREETRLLKPAILSKALGELLFVYFALVQHFTSMGPGECKSLRVRDVDFEKNTVNLTSLGAKNSYRVRTIPLNHIAAGACRELIAQLEKPGPVSPDWFLFPLRRKQKRKPALDPIDRVQASARCGLKFQNWQASKNSGCTISDIPVLRTCAKTQRIVRKQSALSPVIAAPKC